jgi:hypothetical protein
LDAVLTKVSMPASPNRATRPAGTALTRKAITHGWPLSDVPATSENCDDSLVNSSLARNRASRFCLCRASMRPCVAVSTNCRIDRDVVAISSPMCDASAKPVEDAQLLLPALWDKVKNSSCSG